MMNKAHPFGAEPARAGDPIGQEGQDRHGLHVYHPKEAGGGQTPETGRAKMEAARKAKEEARAEIAQAQEVLGDTNKLYLRDYALAISGQLSVDQRAKLYEAGRPFYYAWRQLDEAIGQVWSPGNRKIETPAVIADLTEKLRQANEVFGEALDKISPPK